MPITTLQRFLPFSANAEQTNALLMLANFVDFQNQQDFFILRGSAGTGKTSLVKAVVDYLADATVPCYLAAPTGRAAKIIGQKTKHLALTIHHTIYKPEALENGGVKMARKVNMIHTPSIYIIDEASMISDTVFTNEHFFVPNSLLADLLNFIKQGNQRNKVIFIGDVYQLPPVKSLDSPALNGHYIQQKYGYKGECFELTTVMRQGEDSYILKNATAIRESIRLGKDFAGLTCPKVNFFNQSLLYYLQHFDAQRPENVGMIAFANRDVNYFNNAIRQRLGKNSSTLAQGDLVSVQNNWLGNSKFIVKGEYGVIKNIDPTPEIVADLHFTTAEIAFTDNLGEKFNVSTKILLDTITSENGTLTNEQEKMLTAHAMKHNPTFRESKKPYDDKYVGAMRLRYGYASTCHKAQGGEWDRIILHPYYNRSDNRWLYTAVTRAKQELVTWAA